MAGCQVRVAGEGSILLPDWRVSVVAQFSFGAWLRTPCRIGAVPASQFLVGRQAARTQLELAGTGASAPRGREGLKGCWQREHMPGGDQDLAGDGGLGGVALPAAAQLDVEVELMPGVVADARPAGRPRSRPTGASSTRTWRASRSGPSDRTDRRAASGRSSRSTSGRTGTGRSRRSRWRASGRAGRRRQGS